MTMTSMTTGKGLLLLTSLLSLQQVLPPLPSPSPVTFAVAVAIAVAVAVVILIIIAVNR